MRGWVKLDDQVTEHPKLESVGPVAAWVYVCSITYCNRNLTDGFIPRATAQRLAASADAEQVASLILRLVDVGLWDQNGSGFYVHDYLEYQRSKADIEQLSNDRKAAGSLGGKASSRAKDKQVLKQNASKAQVEQEQEKEQELPTPPQAAVEKVRKPRAPDLVWDFVVSIEGEPLDRYRAARGRIVEDLKLLLKDFPPGRHDSELRRRHGALAREWGDSKATARALVQHWHRAATMNGHASHAVRENAAAYRSFS